MNEATNRNWKTSAPENREEAAAERESLNGTEVMTKKTAQSRTNGRETKPIRVTAEAKERKKREAGVATDLGAARAFRRKGRAEAKRIRLS